MAAQHSDSRDLRIGSILNEYLDRKQRGERVSEQELLDANPDLAEELRGHFGMVQQVIPGAGLGLLNGPGAASLPQDALPGYEIIDEIHRGGQGVIYSALQKATRRKVAVKVMREGPFAGWRDRARFEREVQVLGSLKHPRIVTIHDSGAACHCHYFVMDYISGLPLDAWLNSAAPSTRDILTLLVKICDAVNAAHLKGIIHRDLKPGNIRIDENGEPHVLDFGLAKVAGETEAAADAQGGPGSMTMVGQFVGSLPWTSPEQAQGHVDQIDTRTDVYALGVILYHMLTGQFPYEVVGPVRDVLNRIVSVEPARPRTIRADLPRDVEAVVLKCLRKDPHRRYQTAGELGRDIERYLQGEPVAARSDSGFYVLTKTLQRYRVPVAVAAAFLLLIAGSLAGTASLWRQAVAERDRALVAEREQMRERDRADQKAAEAEQARQFAELEQARAEQQAERLRRTTYHNRIALAQNACEQNYLTQAHLLLEDCPADLRGWEWYYLSKLSRPASLLDVQADSQCVAAVAFEGDGGRVATGGCDGVVKVWNSETGSPLSQFAGHTAQVTALAFSSDGRWIASAGRDKTLRLWDTASGSQSMLQKDRQYIYCLSFNPDSTRLVGGGQDKILTFWDVQTGQVLHQSPRHGGEISSVAFSPDGKQVASAEFLDLFQSASKIRISEAETGRPLREIEAHAAPTLCIAYSPDGSRLASGSSIPPGQKDAQGTLKIFATASGEELLSLPGHEGFVNHLAFSPDGALLASVGSPRTPAFGMAADRTLKIWNPTTGEEMHTYSAHDGGGRAVAWAARPGVVFSGGMDGRLKAWPAVSPPNPQVLPGHSGAVLRVAFSPDGKRLVSSSGQGQTYLNEGDAADNTVRVWDLETRTAKLVIPDHTNAVLALAWSPDGELIASGGADRTIRVWNSRTGTSQQVIGRAGGVVQGIAFSPDQSAIVAITEDTLTFWGIADGQQQDRLSLGEDIASVAFSPDGRWLAAASVAGTVTLWDWASGQEFRSLSADSGLTGAWFSPDSKLIATGHENGTIHIWEASTGEQMVTIRGPAQPVHWAEFSPDGERLASCTTDMLLKLWDVRSGHEVYNVRAHDAPVTCIRFSPDGKTIITAGQDGLIKFWDSSW